MTYYKVKKQYNDKQLLKYKKGAIYPEYYGFLIPNELYTGCEIKRMQARGINIKFDYFEPVNVSKNNIYWFFGVRFSGALK